MGMLEQFAGKRAERKDPAPMPVPQRPQQQRLNEKDARSLAAIHDLYEERDALKLENEELRNELRLLQLRNADIERQIVEQRFDLEAYRRYSVEVQTHLQHIVD